MTDKSGVQFNPQRYFSPEARARRRRQHLPAFEATDLPVRPDYVAAIMAHVDTVTLVSRWFNAVSCRATPAQAAALRQLPGVASVQRWPMRDAQVTAVSEVARLVTAPHEKLSVFLISQTTGNQVPNNPSPQDPNNISANDYLLARRQVAHLDGPALRAAGLQGQGLRIAVFDVGFRGLPDHPAFAELMDSKRIVATHDFLRNRDDVFVGGSHGTEVMGCLAGRLPAGSGGAAGPALGLAPAAEYLLARTEQLHRERYAEEEAWLAAVEWADRLGADIINSSLAYTEQRYFPEQMDGRRSLIARAANIAARKGMLVVSAAGNDGDDDWVRIGTPADADSALAIGGLDPETGLHVDFSSYGPTADRRRKPNLAAFGIVLTTTPGGRYERLEGTSFSAPLVAGLAAALWQRQRQLTAMQLFKLLEQAGELYPYFDYAHGYGRPRLARATAAAPATAAAATFDFVPHDSLVAVIIRPEAARSPATDLPLLADDPAVNRMPTATESPAASAPKTPPVGQEKPVPADAPPLVLLPEPSYPAYLYWNLADRRGVLRRYETRAVTQRLVVQVPRRLLRNGDVLRVHFKGYTATYSE
ncbi:S8 family serine peptidase [Hymenobacter sp. DH14]|uniref:S8 family serine peptidase n=1 Tax=Hymenobacter cyanobacteriorum TaxID=2926463 RepID=A0A9X2AGA3_9BACT|nr:S8 family serine peptidase [Hymenobacter cyanobacteriorum]MCI1187418.1 S8 family serine peptidase [Hymenobacter cyanobacteriorum]